MHSNRCFCFVRCSQMDFPVEATVPLTSFSDKSTVEELISSHDFSIIHRTRGGLRIKGSFLKLKSVKDSLEQLLESENFDLVRTLSKLQSTSSEEKSSSGRTRGRTGSRTSSSSSPINTSESLVSNSHQRSTFSDPTGSCSTGARPKDSFRPGSEFLVDTDVYKYAALVRGEILVQIQQNHRVGMLVQETGDSSRIILQGKNAMKATGEVMNLMEDLSKSLCTQDVLLKDLSPQGRDLMRRIQKSGNIYRSVLVYEKGNGLRLIGSSHESYALKQKLLGGTVEKDSRSRRSSSLSPKTHQNTENDSGAAAVTPPAGGMWYDKDASGGKTGEDKNTNLVHQTKIKPSTPTGLKQLLPFTNKDIKEKFKRK